MPAKALTRSVQPTYKGHASHIPTTIKNPERVAHRRTELIEVATKMFLERGFHNTSIRDIVRACSFNVASLYMYVSSKEDILYLVAQDLMNNIAQRLVGDRARSRIRPSARSKSVLPATARSSAASAARFACSTARSDFCHPSRARM